jgi:hypothetical protein
MLILCVLTRTEMLTDWDSWEYAALAAQGQPSTLCLGRWWFIFFMRLAYLAGRALGVEPTYCFIPMQAAVSIMSAAALAAIMHWVYLITGRLRPAMIAAAVALISPAMAVYCSAVMTEGPALLFIALALIGWDSAVSRSARQPAGAVLRAVLAGMALGIAANMREPALLLCAWPIASCFIDRPRQRWLLLSVAAAGAAATLAVGVGMAWLWSGTDPVTVLRSYIDYMRKERETFGGNLLAHVGFLFTHFSLATPLAVFAFIACAVRYFRGRRLSGPKVARPRGRRLKWLAISCLPYAAANWYNPNLSFNFRLILPPAWMLLPISALAAETAAGWIYERLKAAASMRPLVVAAAAGCGALLGLGLTYVLLLTWHFRRARYQAEVCHAMLALPKGAAVIPGTGSPVGTYLNRTGLRRDLKVLVTDFGWTADYLADRVKVYWRDSRRVYINLDARAWVRKTGENLGWKAVRRTVRRFELRPAKEPFKEITRKAASRAARPPP